MKMNSTLFRRFTCAAMLILMLGMLACRFDFENEVWFNPDLSGKASITVTARDLVFSDQEEADAQLETNVLQKYEDLIKSTPGAKLISNETTDLGFDGTSSYQYQVIFSFDSPATLNKIIARTDAMAVNNSNSGKATTITFYPPAMSMLDKAELESQIGDLSDVEISYYLDVHAPAILTGSSDFDFEPNDDKHRKWMIIVDEEWFANPTGEYYIEY